jgi:hypothetical protein
MTTAQAYKQMQSYKRHARKMTHASKCQAATALGFTSLAIGLTELLATKQVQNLLGIEGKKSAAILRLLGVRECLHGVDLLTHDDPNPGLKARVAGDLLDGALLTAAGFRTDNPTGFATACALVAPVVLADMIFA